MARVCGVSIVGAMLVACGWGPTRPGLTEQDQALLSAMVLEGRPVDATNPYLDSDEVATFGQQLFFDRGLSAVSAADGGFALATDGVACADCHAPKHAFSDERAARNVSFGVGPGWTARNSPTVLNVAFYEWWGWDGRADTLWGQAVNAYVARATMAGSELRLVKAVAARYPDRYRALFGEALPAELDPSHPNAARFNPPDGALTSLAPADQQLVRRAWERLLKAWATYMSRLTSADSPFDRFAKGDDGALSPGQRRGLSLFFGKAGCVECHRGPMFTDNRFHSVGVGQRGANVPKEDLGRTAGLVRLKELAEKRATDVPAPTSDDRGRFRTKSLRNVAETAPYMHAGQLETLKDVVWFYDRGGDRDGAGTPSRFLVPLGLSEGEQNDLVEFLQGLTGAPPAERWLCDNSRLTPGATARKHGAPCAEVP